MNQQLNDDSTLSFDDAKFNAIMLEETGIEDEEIDSYIDEEIDESTADDDGYHISNDELLGEEDDSTVIESNDGFISDTGEIVVMDNSLSEDSFYLQYIDITKIAVLKRIRFDKGIESLLKSVRSTGLLVPVVVAPKATDGLFVLLDGYRRMQACARCGIRNIPCIVNNKVRTTEIPILEAMYNHNKKYTIREIVAYIDYLEKQKGIMSPSMIEYLLQMNNGDYTKLKDILNDDDDDIVSKLMDGQLSISDAFKKLEQRRKKESAEEKELRKAEKVFQNEKESGADKLVDTGEVADESCALTEEEIKELAISANDMDAIDDESLQDMVSEGANITGFQPHKQDPQDRERLDPALRKSVLARDENTCKICQAISGMEYIEVLDVHHIQEVYLGGNDAIENLVTACTVCHKLIHLYARGELHIRPLEELSVEEQSKFKRIVKLGNIIRKGMALKGMKKEQLKQMDKADTIGRRLKGSSDQVAG